MLRTAFVVVVLSLSAPALAAQDAVDYGVKPGDQIETTFYTAGGETLGAVQGNRLVDREGNLFFPYIGTVHVEGLDAGEIRGLLTKAFEPFYKDPVITVNVKLKVNITGIVGAPGHYYFDPTTTIMDAMAQAGGAGLEFTIANNAAANLDHVRLVREGKTIILDLRPEVADPTAVLMTIQSGDWIHVPPKERSRVRDDITFWSGVISLVTSVVAAVALITR